MAEKRKFIERRQFVRIPDSSQITYQIMSRSKSARFLTKNLCQEGVRFFVHEFIPVNSILKLKIKLAKIYFTFETLAQVRWIKEDSLSERFELGVKFIDIPPDTTKYLVKYINTVLQSL